MEGMDGEPEYRFTAKAAVYLYKQELFDALKQNCPKEILKRTERGTSYILQGQKSPNWRRNVTLQKTQFFDVGLFSLDRCPLMGDPNSLT